MDFFHQQPKAVPRLGAFLYELRTKIDAIDKIRTITDNIQSRLKYALSNATRKTQGYAQAK
jgi:hypothetical protein